MSLLSVTESNSTWFLPGGSTVLALGTGMTFFLASALRSNTQLQGFCGIPDGFWRFLTSADRCRNSTLTDHGSSRALLQ